MDTITIVLPASHVITSRDKHVELDVRKLPIDIITKLVLHGLTQKVADSAANATSIAREALGAEADDAAVKVKAADIGQAAMQQVVDNLLAGNWGVQRVGGGGVTPLQAALRVIARNLWVGGFDAAKKAKWKDLDADARTAKLDAFIAAQPEEVMTAWTEQANADIAAEAARKAKVAKLGAKMADDIDL